jgi:hypothetical protein
VGEEEVLEEILKRPPMLVNKMVKRYNLTVELH